MLCRRRRFEGEAEGDSVGYGLSSVSDPKAGSEAGKGQQMEGSEDDGFKSLTLTLRLKAA